MPHRRLMPIETKPPVQPTAEDSSSAPEIRPELPLAADGALLGVALIWGINMPLMKSGLAILDVYLFNAIRLTVSAVVLLFFAIRERRNGIVPSPNISRVQILVFGFLISVLYQLLFLMGLARTTSGNTALIMATIPLWTAVFARGLIGERLQRMSWIGLMIALIGTLVVVAQKGEVSASREQLLGNVLVLSSALVWAGGTVYSRPLLTKITPMQLSAAASVMALPVHYVVAAGRLESNMPALQSVTIWLIIAFAGVLSSGLALPMWNFGVRQAGASHAAAVQNLVPLVAVLSGWAMLGEVMTVAQGLGGLLILCGLMVMRAARKPG